MAERVSKGLVIAAPNSGSGKTVVTLGLLAAMRARGITAAPAKTGPDYIDPAFLARAAGREAVNLDPWAMRPQTLHAIADRQADAADLLLVEGVMGLFDSAADGIGSTGDLAEMLGLPVVFVIDCARQSQSVGALVSGFAQWRTGLHLAGVILNRVGSENHEAMLREALGATGIACLGAIRRNPALEVPDRQLGLTLPGEVDGFDGFLAEAARVVGESVDLDAIAALAGRVERAEMHAPLPPLGQHVAIARDAAFAFCYPHWLDGWRVQGAQIGFFSPLADEAPDARADAVFLPGGYPELHGARLASAARFKAGLKAARDRGALIYGECGGFMVLGQGLTDGEGKRHEMACLLPLTSHIDKPRRTLGYRHLNHEGLLPWGRKLRGHEFHYSSAAPANLPPLFTATDARGTALPAMGAVDGRVMGSYAHVIDLA